MSNRNDGNILGNQARVSLSFSQFQIGSEIGRGQFSVVHRALFLPKFQTVAIKRVQLFEMVDSKARADCIKEIELLKKLHHPNIVQYLGSFEDGRGQLLIILELAAAGDLAKFLLNCQRSMRCLSEKTIWYLFVQIVSGLEHIHAQRIVHRDIKPANVFITSELVVKLGDLGLGRFFSSNTVAVHSLVGTPYYMSPERLNQCGYDFSSDIWSLGCLLYEMAALQPPFSGFKSNWNSLRRNVERCEYPPLPSDLYSSELRHLVESCLQRVPSERPKVQQVLQAARHMEHRSSSSTLDVVIQSPHHQPQISNSSFY